MKELVMIIRPEKLEDIKHILDKNASYTALLMLACNAYIMSLL